MLNVYCETNRGEEGIHYQFYVFIKIQALRQIIYSYQHELLNYTPIMYMYIQSQLHATHFASCMPYSLYMP